VHGYVIDENEKTAVEGKLYYRGYDVNHLVAAFKNEQRFGFEETVYLLLFGSLPTRSQLDAFCGLLGRMRALPGNFTEDMILKSPSSNIMNKLARSVLVGYSYDDRADDISIPNVVRQCIELIARFPTMVAYGYQALAHYYEGRSLFLHNPRPDLGTAENLLMMIRADGAYTRMEAEILDLALVLHAEHGGGNNSAFAMHVVTSTDTDTYSAVAAAVGSLKGPRHGGACLRVGEMIEDLQRTLGPKPSDAQITAYLEKLIDRQAFDRSGLIYGLGHPVYTISDPRAMLLRARAEELAEVKGCKDEFEVYHAVERLGPRVFQRMRAKEKPLCANVDLYSGLIYSMLGIPRSLHTPIFAVSRIAGWCAHRIEELVSGKKIIRPAYKSVVRRLDYQPIDSRVAG
jgi:citrate synthase